MTNIRYGGVCDCGGGGGGAGRSNRILSNVGLENLYVCEILQSYCYEATSD